MLRNETMEGGLEPNLARYARQLNFSGIGEEGQRRLLDSFVVIIGCGAVGTNIANALARAGVGRLRLVDRDYIELSNLQRQLLFDEQDLRDNLPKAIAAARKLKEINSEIEIEGLAADANTENIEELIEGAQLVMDGTDNFETRFLINDACLKHNVPWIYSGAVSSYGVSQTIIPHQTACLRCLYNQAPAPGSVATCDMIGVLGPAVSAITAVSAAEAIKYIVGKGSLNRGVIHFDLYEHTYEQFEGTSPQPDCPACGLGRYEYLTGEKSAQNDVLCGRGAVQLKPPHSGKIDLERIAAGLKGAVNVLACNEYLLRLKADDYDLTVFRDGRAIVKGTEEPAVARSLYAKFIGS